MIDTDTVLGCKAEDMVTGFTGIITGRCDYLNGCTQFCLTPPVNEAGKCPKGEWFDNSQLIFIDFGISEEIPGPVEVQTMDAAGKLLQPGGGPQRDTPPT